MRWAIFLILTLLPSLSFAQGQWPQGDWGGPLHSLSQRERAELSRLIHNICVYDLDKAKHKKFWEKVDSHAWSEKELPEVFDRLVGRYVHNRYMFQAVLDAYEKKIDTKGGEYQEYEAKLLRMDVISKDEIEESNEFIYKVAHGEPVVIEGLWGDPWAEGVFVDQWAGDYRVNLILLDKQYKEFQDLFDRNAKDFTYAPGPTSSKGPTSKEKAEAHTKK